MQQASPHERVSVHVHRRGSAHVRRGRYGLALVGPLPEVRPMLLLAPEIMTGIKTLLLNLMS